MYRYCLFITVFFLSLSAQFGFARQSLKDYGGYKDPALFTRMPHYYLPNSGSVEELQYQAYEFYVTSGNRSEKKRIEGRFSRHTYEYDEKAAGARPSSLQIIRNYQAAAKQIGGQILFDDGSRTTILFEKEGKETWVEVLPRNQGYLYHVRMVEREGMKQDVVANADVFKAGLQQSGHVEVPGIFFDTGRSVVKPESDAALQEVAKLVKSDPSLKVWVVGHTDSTGTVESNLSLSSARAAAVVEALVSRHGADPKRLAPHGAGPFAPVASNDTEEGRAKNRRVELVKMP